MCSETSQTSKMKLFAKTVYGIQPLIIFEKHSILDLWLGFEYASNNLVQHRLFRNKLSLQSAKDLLIANSIHVSPTSNWLTHNLTSNWFIIKPTSDQLCKLLWWNNVSRWPIALWPTFIDLHQMQTTVLLYFQKKNLIW